MRKKKIHKRLTEKTMPVSSRISNARRQISEFDAKLNDEERKQIITWLIERKSTGQIVELVEQKFKKTISRNNVWQYGHTKKWGPVIRSARIRFDKELTRIPIANKSVRLALMQKVAEEGLKWNLKGETRLGMPIYELNLTAVTSAVKQAQEEVEGKGASIHVAEGGKVIFQDIKIEEMKGKPVGELLGILNGRLSNQFARQR